MRKDYGNTTGWQHGFHSNRKYNLIGDPKKNPKGDRIEFTTEERKALLRCVEAAFKEADLTNYLKTTKSRQALGAALDKLGFTMS